MSSAHKNLSIFSTENLPDVSDKKFAMVVAEWNEEVTNALAAGAHKTLLAYGAKEENVIRVNVPGSYELTFAAQKMAQKSDIDAVICIGCVIQGDTKHFDFICDAVAKGITDLNIKFNLPVIFGVLTPNTQEQAEDRAGGKHGNKGDEAAVTAIKMLGLRKSFDANKKKVGF